MNEKRIEFLKHELNNIFSNIEPYLSLKNKKIFITGASGYIGKWLVLACVHLNRVHNLNIHIVATSRGILDSELSDLITDPNIVFVNANVRNPIDIPHDVNYVIHLAGEPDRRIHASDPLGVISTIVDGTRNVLDSSVRIESLEKVLVFTSGLIHGRQSVDGSNVHYSTNDTLNFSASYVESKRVQENICHIYSRQFQLPISIVRPYTFIGPLQDLDRPWAVNNFIQSAISGKNIKVLGNPETLKTFMYPTDMLKSILLFMLDDNAAMPLELGSNQRVSLEDVAEKIRKEVTSSINIDYLDPEHKLTKQDFVCDDKMNKCFNTVDFDETIIRSINWYNLD